MSPVPGKLKELSIGDFLDLFDDSVRSKIVAAGSRYPDKQAIVCFENLDMWSSNLGHRSAVVVGPSTSWTLEKVVEPGFRLGDVPSRFQYPVAYVDYRTA